MNIGSEPTYFTTLKDKEGLIKQYAMVSVTDYSIVGTGETIPLAIKDYQQGMKNVGISPNIDDTLEKNSVTGTILRIASEFDGQSTVYKVILQEYKDRIYLIDSALSDELALTTSGDRVTIDSYSDKGAGIQAASGFDNQTFSQK